MVYWGFRSWRFEPLPWWISLDFNISIHVELINLMFAVVWHLVSNVPMWRVWRQHTVITCRMYCKQVFLHLGESCLHWISCCYLLKVVIRAYKATKKKTVMAWILFFFTINWEIINNDIKDKGLNCLIPISQIASWEIVNCLEIFVQLYTNMSPYPYKLNVFLLKTYCIFILTIF